MKKGLFICFMCLLPILFIFGCAIEKEVKTDCAKEMRKGPYCQSIMLAVSEDGVNWEGKGAIKEHASVPDAILDNEGNIRIYYVDGKTNTISVGMLEVEDWEFKEVNMRELAVDPDVVVEDGEYIIYYFAPSSEFISEAEEKHIIKSAVSKDGINFGEGKEVYSNIGITDPDVFRIEDGWIMYVSLPKEERMNIALSEDGKGFENAGAVEFDGIVSSTIKAGNEYWMFYQNREKGKISIKKAVSKDGKEWEGHDIVLLGESDAFNPAIVYYNGKYYLFYNEFIES
ncbi:hypothetical protein HZB88_04545 [archaeon]|nr:hypothetical protein [archaeon]